MNWKDGIPYKEEIQKNIEVTMKSALYEDKKSVFLKACNHEEAEYVPNFISGGNSILSYAGITYYDIKDDEEKYRQVLGSLFNKMWCDTAILGISGNPHAFEVLEGHTENFLGPDGVTSQNKEQLKMRDDEYPQLISDPFKFLSDVLVPRKYPNLFDGDKAKAVNALKVVVEESIYHAVTGPFSKTRDIIENEFNVVAPNKPQNRIMHPLDMLFDFFRGFSGALTDIRRRPQEVKAACEVLWETMCNHFENHDSDFPFASTAPHIPSYISPKVFYKFYWPYAEKMYNNIAQGGGKVIMLLEGNWLKIIECFKEVQKDCMILTADEDDIFELNSKIGDYHTISGGVKMQDVRLGTKDKCIEHAKRVIDTCAPGGGLIFTSDKTLACAGDLNDVFIDVFNFAHEYSIKK